MEIKAITIWEFILLMVCGIATVYLVMTAVNIFFPNFLWNEEQSKPDGELYLHVGNQTQTIYLGHEAIITLCRGGYERGYEDYKNITCKERFEGCGAVNCECWVRV